MDLFVLQRKAVDSWYIAGCKLTDSLVPGYRFEVAAKWTNKLPAKIGTLFWNPFRFSLSHPPEKKILSVLWVTHANRWWYQYKAPLALLVQRNDISYSRWAVWTESASVSAMHLEVGGAVRQAQLTRASLCNCESKSGYLACQMPPSQADKRKTNILEASDLCRSTHTNILSAAGFS